MSLDPLATIHVRATGAEHAGRLSGLRRAVAIYEEGAGSASLSERERAWCRAQAAEKAAEAERCGALVEHKRRQLDGEPTQDPTPPVRRSA